MAARAFRAVELLRGLIGTGVDVELAFEVNGNHLLGAFKDFLHDFYADFMQRRQGKGPNAVLGSGRGGRDLKPGLGNGDGLGAPPEVVDIVRAILIRDRCLCLVVVVGRNRDFGTRDDPFRTEYAAGRRRKFDGSGEIQKRGVHDTEVRGDLVDIVLR